MKRLEFAKEIARLETERLGLRKESEGARIKAMSLKEMEERYEYLKGEDYTAFTNKGNILCEVHHV
jgi:hypothetical protein